MLRSIVAILLLFLGLSGPAFGQATPDPRCTDDRGTDRCAEAQQGRVLALFAARPIEQHVRAGDQLRRVFFVDGYGSDLVAIEFIRTARRDPLVRVRFARRDGLAKPALEASVPARDWDDLIHRSEHFDQRFAPREVRHETEIVIASHCWVYTIEAVDPPDGFAPARQRRKVESACEHGPGQLLAHDMARLALRLLPHCAQLDPDHHRNEPAILAACGLLGGDRMAAADVLNRLRPLTRISGPQDAALLQGLFDYDLRIDWNGQTNSGGGSAASFWAGQFVGQSGSANLYLLSVEGEDARRVSVRGTLSRSVDTPPGPAMGMETASVELIWSSRPNGPPFQISSARVGPWEPFPPPSAPAPSN